MNEKDSRTLLKAIVLIGMWSAAIYEMVALGKSNTVGLAIIMSMFII